MPSICSTYKLPVTVCWMRITVNSLYLWVPHLQIHPTVDQKYLKRTLVSALNVSKHFWTLYPKIHYYYLNIIYIVLGIISDIEIIKNTGGYVWGICKCY